MSVRCISKVLEESSHSGTELLMLVVLADYSDDDGYSYPAVATLARKCRMSTRNANYILSALQASGELIVLKNEGPKGVNRYRIVLSALGKGAPLQPASPLKAIAPPQSTSPLQEASPLKPASDTPEAGFPIPLKPTSDKPSLNRQDPSKDFPGFARFWSAWPPSNRKGAKAKCLDAWKKADGERDVEMIVAHVQAMKSSTGWTKSGGEFIPAPLVYLGQRRWDGAELAGDICPNDPWAGAVN